MSLASLLLVAMLSQGTAPADSNGVPRALLDRLSRGVNVTRWFCYVGNPNDQTHFRNYWRREDADALRELNVKYVRLCVSPDVIYRQGAPDPTNLKAVDAGIDRLQKDGFAVIWDLHDNGQLKIDQGQNQDGFVSFWQTVARHNKGRYEKSLVFELVNEPVYQKNPKDWFALQERAVRAVREIDPKRTIMVSGTSWSGIDALPDLKPLSQKNLVYTAHCYDPFLFTHQGASWVGDPMVSLKKVPFPSSPEAVDAVMAENPEKVHGALTDYGKQRYDAGYLLTRLSKISEYGRKNHVPVLLGEFGAYPLVSPPESRARWFSGMRAALTKLGLPNAVWGYDDALGLGREIKNGKLWLDPVCLKNLY